MPLLLPSGKKLKILAPTTINFTVPSAIETYQASPTALPTSEPVGSPQITYTIADSHFPTCDRSLSQSIYSAIFVVSGRNLSGSTQTVNYKLVKSPLGVGANTIGTGSISCTNNYYWSFQFYNSYNCVAGDIYTIFLWAGSTSVNWNYDAMQVLLTRPKLQEFPDKTMFLTNQISCGIYPSLTLGNPYSSSSFYINLFMNNKDYNTQIINAGSALTANLYMCQQDSTYGLYQLGRGDYDQNISTVNNTSGNPVYPKIFSPSKIIFSPTNYIFT